MSPGARRLVFRLLAALGGLALGLLVGEGVLRLQRGGRGGGDRVELGWARRTAPPAFGGDCASQTEQAALGDILWPTKDVDIVFRLLGGLDTCFRGERLQTNVEGLRASRSYPPTPPPGVHRLLVLGDSQAFGWGVPLEQSLGARLEMRLETLGHGPVEVINAAVPGSNTYQQAALLERVGMDYQPDCVLVLFTGNDLALPFFLLKDAAVPSRWRSLLLLRFQQVAGSKRWFRFSDEEMISFVSQVDLARVPEAYRHMVGIDGYREALRRMKAAAGDVPIVNVAELSELRPEVAEEIVQLQAELGIVHLPMTWPRRERYLLDAATDPHPNPAAHRAFARRLASELADRGLCVGGAPEP